VIGHLSASGEGNRFGDLLLIPVNSNLLLIPVNSNLLLIPVNFNLLFTNSKVERSVVRLAERLLTLVAKDANL
jgi:hypothetical protein